MSVTTCSVKRASLLSWLSWLFWFVSIFLMKVRLREVNSDLVESIKQSQEVDLVTLL